MSEYQKNIPLKPKKLTQLRDLYQKLNSDESTIAKIEVELHNLKTIKEETLQRHARSSKKWKLEIERLEEFYDFKEVKINLDEGFVFDAALPPAPEDAEISDEIENIPEEEEYVNPETLNDKAKPSSTPKKRGAKSKGNMKKA